MAEYDERLKITEQLDFTDDGVARIKKKLGEMADEVMTDLEWKIKDDLAGWISDHIFQQYHRAVEAMLKGQEDAFKRAIGAENYTGRENLHVGWDGKVFEGGLLELRRKLAEVNENILKDELVLDLQAKNKALELQTVTLSQRLDNINRRGGVEDD